MVRLSVGPLRRADRNNDEGSGAVPREDQGGGWRLNRSGDFPMEFLESNTWLPIDESSFVKFTLQSKNEMYGLFDEVLFKPQREAGRFSYPADDKYVVDFEAQMTELVREYKGEGEYLSPHHPDKPGARDDACDATALMLLAASVGEVGDIIVV